MNRTGIAWAKWTLNPIVGCSHISDGCAHCYAEGMATTRLAQSFPDRYSALPWTKANAQASIQYFPERLHDKDLACAQRKGSAGPVFLNSMSDLFHEYVSDTQRAEIFATIRDCPAVIFIILTKRPENAVSWHDWPPNCWFLATVENQRERHRIETLRSIPIRIKGLSCEPLLEPLGELDLTDLHWVIVGGESGSGARPMNVEWARDLQRQCHEQGVAFFMKQLSSHKNGRYSKFELFPADLQEREYPERFPDGAR